MSKKNLDTQAINLPIWNTRNATGNQLSRVCFIHGLVLTAIDI